MLDHIFAVVSMDLEFWTARMNLVDLEWLECASRSPLCHRLSPPGQSVCQCDAWASKPWLVALADSLSLTEDICDNMYEFDGNYDASFGTGALTSRTDPCPSHLNTHIGLWLLCIASMLSRTLTCSKVEFKGQIHWDVRLQLQLM